MRESGVELCVGDSVQIENRVVTVIDIVGDEVTFRIDQCDDEPASSSLVNASLCDRRPPR